MSALQVVTPKTKGTHGTCQGEGCNRAGRVKVSIAGYPLHAEQLSAERLFWLCLPCAREWNQTWAEMSGEAA